MNRKFVGILAAAAFAACSSGTSTSTTGSGSGAASGAASGGTSGATTGTASGSTSGSGTTSGASSSTSGSTGYCNGVELTDTASTPVYLATYPKSDEIRVNCTHIIDPIYDGGVSVTYLAGILDRNTYVQSGTLYTVWPASCADLDGGAEGYTPGTVVTDGGTSVATALAGAADVTGPLYGIVTFVNGPYSNDTGGHSGSAWIQDLMPDGGLPPPNSGVSVYFPKASANDAGASGAGLYPATGIALGDVVALTTLKWSPYVPTTDVNGKPQNQFEFGATSTVTVIGQGVLPAPIPLSGADFQDAGSLYMGMRVIQTTVPDSVESACPIALFSAASGG